mgnify:FL=1
MENEPLVTIAIPNYNYAHYLENCLNSLLNQTYSNFEVYFRDNQSTDDSLKIALGYKDKFAARGIYFNVSDNKRNLGSDINSELARRDAEGEYIYTLASDDAVKPEFLEKTMKVFEDHPEVYTVITNREEIDENGTTFEENSLIKAKAIKAYCEKNDINEIIMTDDAGLCIDALNGEPGVYSARYAGDHAPQIVAINKVLSKMENVKDEDRTAKFVCVLTLMMPDGKINVARGETLGRIVRTPGPLGKLTYGPIFIPEGFDKTMNELTEEELGVTHREKALKQILNYLKEEQ